MRKPGHIHAYHYQRRGGGGGRGGKERQSGSKGGVHGDIPQGREYGAKKPGMSRDRISGEWIKVKGDAHTHGSDQRVDIGGVLGSDTTDNAVQTTEKIRVEGVRRVWGTLRESTCISLKRTLTKFSPSSTLVVKQKTI